MPVFFAYGLKKIIKWIIFFGAAFSALILFYGFFIEPGRIEINEISITDDVLFQFLGTTTIAHISDLHIDGNPGKQERNLLDKLRQAQPDLIVITGDMAQWGKNTSQTVKFLQQLEAPFGVFCVLGDSDLSTGRNHCVFCHLEGNPHLLRQFPVVLKNSFVRITSPQQQGKSFFIAGIMPREYDSQTAFDILSDLPAGDTPVLFLSHFSFAWNKVKTKRPLLWLSGDNHGGQIAMPGFIWEILSGKSDKEHKAGLFREEEHKWLYVTRGIGVTRSFPFRIGVPPELTVIRVKQKNNGK